MTEPTPESESNRLSIYLIKEGYKITEAPKIIKEENSVYIDIEDVGKFYYREPRINKPSWIKDFFKKELDSIEYKFRSKSSKGILLVEVDVKDQENNNSSKRIFAITFGYGKSLMEKESYEKGFGLKTALSIIDENSIRKIVKKSLGPNPKNIDEQVTKLEKITSFGIDIEQDLMQSITGTAKDKHIDKFGKTITEKDKTLTKKGIAITGKDSLNMLIEQDINSIKDFLVICYERYVSKEYQDHFKWIDHIEKVADTDCIDELDSKLIKYFNDTSKNIVWMSVPENVNFEFVNGFKYKNVDRSDTSDMKDDISLENFMASLTTKEEGKLHYIKKGNLSNTKKDNLAIKLLKRKKISAIGARSEHEIHTWSAYDCIYCEHIDTSTEDHSTFILINGTWYKVEQNYTKRINNKYEDFVDDQLAKTSVNLPKYDALKHKCEEDYNTEVSNREDFYLMDRKMIYHESGTPGGIEFCDLYTEDKKIIHVKRHGGSRTLGHLFNQGLISAELFSSDAKFMEGVRGELLKQDCGDLAQAPPNPSDYEIIFAIVEAPAKKGWGIPFFSKVALLHIVKVLEGRRYKVSLEIVQKNKEL